MTDLRSLPPSELVEHDEIRSALTKYVEAKSSAVRPSASCSGWNRVVGWLSAGTPKCWPILSGAWGDHLTRSI